MTLRKEKLDERYPVRFFITPTHCKECKHWYSVERNLTDPNYWFRDRLFGERHRAWHEFNPDFIFGDGAKRDGIRTWIARNHCPDCSHAYQTSRAILLAPPRSETRRRYLRDNYGIGTAEYEQLLEKSGRRCEICSQESPLDIDHDHANGKIRGVLCELCNRGLGHFRDDESLLGLAIQYLRSRQ